MNTSEKFQDFLSNIKIPDDYAKTISNRYATITKRLNKEFRNTNSETDNTLQVGSYGRWTGIKGISDLDMVYIIPDSKWKEYNKEGGQRLLLQDIKKALEKTYSSSDIKIDRCVVTVKFSDHSHIDIQPVFETSDDDFIYPDTYGEGSWKITKPRKEMEAMLEVNKEKNRNLRRLCKMIRAWKNHNGVVIKGLLIDTLAYNFLNSTSEYDSKSFNYYDEMSRDFFKFLYEQPKNQKEYVALGSKQRVKVVKSFNRKAKKAYKYSCEAIAATSEKEKHNKWRDVYGKDFPKYKTEDSEAKLLNNSYLNTEEFIEDTYIVEINYDLHIDCEIRQNGYRTELLREFLKKKFPLLTNKSLKFFIKNNEVPPPYDIKWKVTNRGEEAIKRDCIRGEIINDGGNEIRFETSNFKGNHFVECYIIKDNKVVARDLINVPIKEF